eukprot:gene9923-10780_t
MYLRSSLNQISSLQKGLLVKRFEPFVRSFSNNVPTSRKERREQQASVFDEVEGTNNKNYHFDKEWKILKQSLLKAFQPVKEMNNFILTDDEKTDGLIVKTKKGNFEFKPDVSNMRVEYKSFSSGYLTYYFNVEQRLWLGIYDDHDLRGIVTRDVLRHYKGVPDF